MKTNRICFGLAALLLATALTGCGKEPPLEPIEPSYNTAPLISTAPPTTTEPTEVTEPTEPTEPAPCLEPVTRLSCIRWQTVPQLLSLGEGQVLACRNDAEEGKGIVNLLEIVDVYEDTVVAQAKNDVPLELLEQSFSDGHFVLKNSRDNTLRIYDRSLQLVKEFSAPNVEGYFSADRKNYYFVDNDVLYRMDLNTGNQGRIALQYDLRLVNLIGVHPDRNIVAARFYRSFYDESYGVCAIDCSTGKFLILNENASQLWFDGDTFYAAVTSDHVYGSDICFGSLSGGVLQKATTSALGSDAVSYTILSGSGILLHRTTDEKNLSTTVYDLTQNGISSQLAQYDYLTSTLGPVYLRREQLIFGVCPSDTEYAPVVIDPKVLSYEKSLSINKEIWAALVDKAAILRYQEEVAGPALPNSLSALRQQADALEEKYGVKILMENQTLQLCMSHAAVQSDPTLIADALTALEQALSLYPKGFLKQFQNGIGEGGLYFCLTGRIQGSLDPVGKALKVRNRYEILLDIGAEELDKTVHHELWHAIEMKLSTDSFDQSRWNAANPKNFLYYGHYDSGYQKLTKWTYAQSGEGCYFVDAYARINPREDRARLMEYVMATDATELLRSPALQKKLQIMSNAIREQFDTTGWDKPHWEQYL